MTHARTGRAGRGLVLALAALALALPLAGCLGRHATSGPEVKPMQLVWSDEFDGPAGQPADTARWKADVGTDWGNRQLEYDTARPENCALDGAGHLALIARREDYQGCAYTSARINTSGRFQQTRGRFEASIRLPQGQGFWPAFWLLGANIATNPWPACGEIDIMENQGQYPRVVHGSLHGPGYSGGSALTRPFALPTGARSFTDDFHVFAVDWDQNSIAWSVDGNVYQTVGPSDLPTGTSWVFDHAFYVLLDLAVGGNYVGGPSADTVFPQAMLVDYVRVYAPAP
jgi:beta-glucanase (GH16 family)